MKSDTLNALLLKKNLVYCLTMSSSANDSPIHFFKKI